MYRYVRAGTVALGNGCLSQYVWFSLAYKWGEYFWTSFFICALVLQIMALIIWYERLGKKEAQFLIFLALGGMLSGVWRFLQIAESLKNVA